LPLLQEIVSRLQANRERIFRYYFVPQAFAALLFLGFSYRTGKVHAHLLLRGVRTRGTIVSFKAVHMQGRSSNGSSGLAEPIYEPAVKFLAGDRSVRFQEWKGQASSAGVGSSVPVIYDPGDPSFAMIDRSYHNWLPWAPCFVIGLSSPQPLLRVSSSLCFSETPNPFRGSKQLAFDSEILVFPISRRGLVCCV